METVHNTLNKFFKILNQNNASSGGCFTCEICTEPVLLNKKFKNMEESGCLHPYCMDCVAKYIETKVVHDNMSDIKCPEVNCSVHLDALSCRSILSKKVFEKWCRVLCESAVLLDASKGGFVHGRCFCPNRKCSELILNECVETKSMVKRSDCPNCKEVFCFSCMVPWKENHRCRHQTGDAVIDIDMDRNDLLFMEMAKRNRWIRCPNCNLCIKVIGLGNEDCWNIITCRCKAQFCYECREKPCICERSCWGFLLVLAVFMVSFLLFLFYTALLSIGIQNSLVYLGILHWPYNSLGKLFGGA